MAGNTIKWAALATLILVIFAGTAAAEEWTKITLVCPICGAINTFQSVTGAPADVYDRAERLQYIFWPQTDKRVLYCCKRCHYTVYMTDWNAIPHDKSEAIHLAVHKLTTDTNVSDYTTIATSARFDMAEKIYEAWGKDDAFMCAFYRAKAYHLDAERNPSGAAGARKKALERASRMLAVELKSGAKKELLFINGSIKHFAGDDEGAIKDLKAAKEISYEDDKDMIAPGIRRDQYLARLIDELIAAVEKPRGQKGAEGKGAGEKITAEVGG